MLVAIVAGFLLWPAQDAAPVRTPPLDGGSSIARYAGPDNYLAWVPGGFDDPAFRQKMERLAGLDEVVVVAGDTLWLRRTEDADGRVVDEPTSPFAFPIDAFAVQASDYAPFVDAQRSGRDRPGARCRQSGARENTARSSVGSARAGSWSSGPARSASAPSFPTTRSAGPRCSSIERSARRLGITHERYLLAQPIEPPDAPGVEAEAAAVRR